MTAATHWNTVGALAELHVADLLSQAATARLADEARRAFTQDRWIWPGLRRVSFRPKAGLSRG